jgi:hypothetical protein
MWKLKTVLLSEIILSTAYLLGLIMPSFLIFANYLSPSIKVGADSKWMLLLCESKGIMTWMP